MKKSSIVFLILMLSIPVIGITASEKDTTGLIKDKYGNGAEIQGAARPA